MDEFRNDETSKEPEEDKLVRELLNDVMAIDIRKQAEMFVKKHFSSFETYCSVCGACNCKNNEKCINCNCQL